MNAQDRIKSCLESICDQSHQPFEIIVVDGHSRDKTREQLRGYPVKFLCEDYGTVGGARQVGLEHAVGTYVAQTDDDTIPSKDWLKNLLRGFTDETVIGVGGGVQYIGNGLWEKTIGLCLNSFLGSGNSVQGRLYKHKRLVSSISGCNSMYRRDKLVEIGGFNTRLSMNEETELNKRIRKHGKLLYVPDAPVLHQQGRGLRKFAKRMLQFGYGRGRLRLWSMQCAIPVAIVALLISLPFFIWFAVSASVIYIAVIGTMGIKFALKEKKSALLLSTPIAYIIEHFSYSLGFWKGLLKL
jgi:GT2 family glycosyltransferase